MMRSSCRAAVAVASWQRAGARTPRGTARGPRRARRGAALVEMALVLPLLVTIALGCTDFGRFGAAYIAVTNAAYVGAEFGATNPLTSGTQSNWTAGIQSAATAEMQGVAGFNSANLTVSSAVLTDAGGNKRVSVTATYPFQTLVSWPSLPGSVNLSRTVELPVIR